MVEEEREREGTRREGWKKKVVEEQGEGKRTREEERGNAEKMCWC